MDVCVRQSFVPTSFREAAEAGNLRAVLLRGKDGRWCRGEHCQHVQEERKDGRWCRGEHSQHMQEESHGPLTKTKRKCGPFQFCFNTTNQHCSSVASGHRHGGPQHLTTRVAAWKLTEMNRMARHLDAYSTRKDGRWCRGEHCQHVQEERKDGKWCRSEHSQHMQEERKDGRWCRGEHCQHVQE
ncbi:uncharacterized protein LOC135101306 isoform X3 [Scylla paramamosain]|uniref:uncharacterized protein LOC135101306 isoform X3 n=1 Tax=Scylla paramamosain TaxID=85552 RepID=UPI003083255A